MVVESSELTVVDTVVDIQAERSAYTKRVRAYTYSSFNNYVSKLSKQQLYVITNNNNNLYKYWRPCNYMILLVIQNTVYQIYSPMYVST